MDQRQTLNAPHLIDLGLDHVLRRYCTAGELSEPRAREAFGDFGDLPVTRHLHALSRDRIWELRHKISAYDAADIALAKAFRAP